VFLNFGGVSPFWQQLRRPFVLSGSVKSAALVEVQRGAWWAELAGRARRRARVARARDQAPRDPEAAAVALAVLIGDRSGLDDGLVRRLQAAGTYHVISISGGNVVLLTALCFLALGLVLRAPRIVAALTLLCTLAYGGLVAGDPSVARAITAASLYLGAAMAGLTPRPLAALLTTACLLVLVDPLIVADVGAWLSFGATLGILVLASPLLGLVPWRLLPAWCRWARPVAALVASTVAAELMLLPVAAAVFGRVTAAGLLLNVVAIPAMAIVQIGGLAVVAASGWLPAASRPAAAVAAGAARALVTSSALVDVWPVFSWRVPPVSIGWIAVYYLAAAAAWRLRDRRLAGRAAVVMATAALVVIALAPFAEGTRPAPGRLRVTAVDVGQGDATLVQLPGGDSLLVDAGGTPGSFDVGGRVVTPALWALGVRRLTWLALTHPDVDHIGGAVAVADDMAPREIWEGIAVPRDPDLQRIRGFADTHAIAWRTVLSGARLETGGPVRIDVVHPPEPDWERQRSRNDDSVVLRIRYGRVDILLTGDAGAEFDERLPPDLASSALRILKAGHHGSRTSTSDRLVGAMRPQAALISVGRGNLFGQPAPDVIARLAAAGAAIFRTDRDGAVSLETDGRTVRIRTALGRNWTIAASGPF
jgi:competence protein ComEC